MWSISPRIDQAHACRLEMSGIACRKNGMPGSSDTGNLHVADLDRLAGTLDSRRNGTCGESRRLVEGLHSALEVLGKEL